MSDKKIFVVTNTEDGWDCVRGVYKADNEDVVYEHLAEEQEREVEVLKRTYVVHRQYDITEL